MSLLPNDSHNNNTQLTTKHHHHHPYHSQAGSQRDGQMPDRQVGGSCVPFVDQSETQSWAKQAAEHVRTRKLLHCCVVCTIPSISNTALLSSFKWWKSLYGRSNYKIKKSNFDVESWKPLAKNFSTKITFFFTSALIIFSFMKSYLFIYIYIHTIFFNFPFEQT